MHWRKFPDINFSGRVINLPPCSGVGVGDGLRFPIISPYHLFLMDSGANRASGSNVLIPCVRTETSPETLARDGGQKSRGMVNTCLSALF